MGDEKNKITKQENDVEKISFAADTKVEKVQREKIVKEKNYENKMHKNFKIMVILVLIFAVVYIYSVFFQITLSFGFHTNMEWIAKKFNLFIGAVFNVSNSRGGLTPLYMPIIISVIGAALAVSGAIYQGLFRNPMASPDVLGVSASGSLGGAIFIMLFYIQINYNSNGHRGFFAMFGQQIFAYGFGLLGVLFVVFIAKAAGRGKISTVSLVLSGVVFSSLIKSVVSFIRYLISQMDPNDERLPQIQIFLMGNFNFVANIRNLMFICIPTVICMIPVMLLRSKMNAMVFGEEEAQAFGINVKVLRITLIVLSTLLTSLTVAFCGPISWIGLVIPHVTRFFTGPDYRILLPASMLTGAIFTLTAYNIAYAFGKAFYTDIFISALGVPIFIYFLIKARRAKNADWA